MYTPANKTQSSFLDFNQPLGLHMNPDNRWIQMADQIPWDVFEKKYAHAFKNERRDGNISKTAAYGTWCDDHTGPVWFFRPGTCRNADREPLLPILHRTPQISAGTAI